MELIIVVIIIGILASISVPQHNRAREKTMDKQVQAILIAIRNAERSRWVEENNYYTSGGILTVPTINQNLNLDILDDGNWQDYRILSSNGFNASVSRTTSRNAGYDRTWWIIATQQNASCTGACP